jgi:hypothetical protein
VAAAAASSSKTIFLFDDDDDDDDDKPPDDAVSGLFFGEYTLYVLVLASMKEGVTILTRRSPLFVARDAVAAVI